MKKIGFLLAVLLAATPQLFGQGAKNIRISEVLTFNTASLQDDYGNHEPWMELVNTAFSTYNVRGMYITTDRSVLDTKLTAPERISRMSIIPNGDARTIMSARQHLLFHLGSNPKQGTFYLQVPIDSLKANWVAIYDGNGIDLIDSVTVPALKANQSYALFKDEQSQYVWRTMEPDQVTPLIDNALNTVESKAARLKRDDPHGFGITVLSMGIVFFCLFLLFVFFSIFGKIMASQPADDNKPRKRQPVKVSRESVQAMAASKAKEATPDQEVYLAVIAMALKQYMDDVHDVESGIITIHPHHSNWTRV
ncbi:MAG: OadG family protein [Prevotella sp.]|nr:OadG family protein [Prevotella sp.]